MPDWLLVQYVVCRVRIVTVIYTLHVLRRAEMSEGVLRVDKGTDLPLAP